MAGRAVLWYSTEKPDVGEGGRTAEGLRAGSWCQSPEAKSVPRAGSQVSEDFESPH